MNYAKTLAALAAALCLAGAVRAAEKPYKVAVLPCYKNWGHVHDYDFAYKAAGYEYTNCVETAEQFEWLDKHLDEFSLVLAPPLFHFEFRKEEKSYDPNYKRPYSMQKFAPRLAKWIQDGGCLFVVDANYAVGLEWFKHLDPAMDLTACVDPRDMKTELKCNGLGPATAKEPLDSILFFPQTAEYGFGWGHMQIPDESKTAWDVLARCGHGCPTLVIRRWGKGIVLVNSLRSYVPQFLENIRVNQQFLNLGITVTGSHMPDPIPGTNVFSFACSNASDKPLSGELRLSLAPMVQDEKGKWIVDEKARPAVYSQRGSAPAGTNGVFTLSCRIRERGRYRATMTFAVGSLSATCFQRDLTLPELFAVTSSRFHGVISQLRRFDTVDIGTSFFPVEGDAGKHRVRLSLRDGAGRAVAANDAPIPLRRGWVPMALSRGVAPGAYTVRGELFVEGGAAPLASSETHLEIAGDGPGFAIADEDNTILSNGGPYLPLVIYHPGAPKECGGYTGEFARIADLGFNAINLFGWAGVGNLDRLHQLDVRTFWEALPHRSPGMSRAVGSHTRNHPSGLMNYTMDEPSEAQFEFVRSLNDAWNEADPYHPTVVVSYQPHHFGRNAYMSDILAPDCYPYSTAKGDDSEVGRIAQWTERAKAASGGTRPVFFVTQAFGGEPPHIWRNMPLQAIVHGAKGLLWYAWNEGNGVGLRWNEALLAEAESLLAQLRALSPAILAAGKDAPRSFGADGDAIHGMVCHVPGAKTKILILVNVTKEKAEADIVLPELVPGAESIAGAYGDAPLATTSNGVHAVLGSYGSGIWCWDGEAPALGRLASAFPVRKLPARRSGRTLKVAADGADGAYTNLQQAVAAAQDGDTILVGEGVWGPIVADNTLVDIVATGSRDATVIDAKGLCRAATLTQKPWGDMAFQTNVLIRGFTIRGGKAARDAFRPSLGGGVLGGTLIDCAVTANEAANGGGVSFANVFDSALFRNTAYQTGGGADRCRIEKCVVRENRANFDGGGLSFCRATATAIRNNTAGRNGGGSTHGSLYSCRVVGNTAERDGGGSIFTTARSTLYKRNTSRWGEGGAMWGGSASFCTFAENAARTGGALSVGKWISGDISAYASVFVGNRATADAATATFERVAKAPKCFVDSTNGIPQGATFAKLAFLDPNGEDYRPVSLSPIVDCATDAYMPRSDTDILGAPRITGGAADAGAFEMPCLPRTALDVDFGCGRDLIGKDRALFPLYAQTDTVPVVKDGALVCDGTQRLALHGDARALYLGYPSAPVATFTCAFRAEAAGGTLFALLNGPENGMWAEVDDATGKLRVVNTYGNPKDGDRAVFETAGKVAEKAFHTVEVRLDRLGGIRNELRVTLDGKEVPCVQTIRAGFPTYDARNLRGFPNRHFQIGGREGGPSFHGAIKSVKVVCDD